MAEVLERRPKSVVRSAYGILNRYGEFWSARAYDSPEDAKKHFDEYWRLPGFTKPPPWSDYRVVQVRQTLTYSGTVDNQ